jgi:CO/xanthine dehydrogenase FAD-binding subunit
MSWKIGDYLYASSAREAMALLRGGNGRGLLVAGGTDLLQSRPACDFIVDISGAGLDEIIRTPEGGLRLGAGATLQSIATADPVLDYAGGAIAAAAQRCGNRPVRSVATLGGNLCSALPSADMAPVLLALEAEVRCSDGEQEESLPLRAFFTGPRRTVLGERILLSVDLPARHARAVTTSRKLARTAEDISLVHVAVSLTLEGRLLRAARIGLGAVAPLPLRAEQAEAHLAGMSLDEREGPRRLGEAAGLAAQQASPISDHRGSGEYRRAMVAVLCRRLLSELLGMRIVPPPESPAV